MIKYILILFFVSFLISCDFNKTDEQDFADFYNTNYEFANDKRHLFTMMIEKAHIENDRISILKTHYNDLTKINSDFDIIIHKIDSCILYKDFSKTEDIYNNYNNLLNQIDSILQGDKNFVTKRFDFNKSNIHSKLKLLRIKNDLVIAVTKCMDFIYMNIDSYGGWSYLGNIETSSIMDTSGKVIVTLSSEAFQKFGNEGNLILKDLVSNNNHKKTNYLVTKNYAFKDISIDSLESGSYTLEGEFRYYGRKGVRNYPFTHKFEVK